MRRLAGCLAWAGVLAVGALLAGAAWLTRHPEAPALTAAREWPVIGPLAGRFQDAYTAPPPDEPDEVGETEAEPEAGIERDSLPGAAAPGSEELPPPGPPLDTAAEAGPPPLGSAPEPVLPRAERPADRGRLSAGLEILGDPKPLRLGPYAAYAGAVEAEVLEYCDALARQVEPVYVARYGVEPVGRPAATVLLFGTKAAYDRFRLLESQLAGIEATGHTGHGIVALYALGRSREAIGETLVHELVHLLNRRALGPALPPWIDEGLADDIAQSPIDERGRIRPGAIGGEMWESDMRIYIRGGHAATDLLQDAAEDGCLRPLAELVELDWHAFVDAEVRPVNYGQASFWIRQLLGDTPPGGAAALREFLAGIAAGGAVDGEALRRRLGRDWDELDRIFRDALLAE